MDSTLKKCSACQEHKPVTVFGVDRSCKDGLRAYCKPCVYIRSQSKKSKASRKKWVDNGGLERQREYAKTAHAKTVRNARLRASRLLKKQERIIAKVSAAVSAGELAHPTKRKCLGCHECADEYHHHNYRRPFDVTPLCRDCHVSLHTYMRHNGLDVQR